MFYDCISIRFRNGIPTFDASEICTVHALDDAVRPPRRAIRPGDVVLIKTPGYPIVKLVLHKRKEHDGPFGGPIVGRAAFFDPIQDGTPFEETTGGIYESN